MLREKLHTVEICKIKEYLMEYCDILDKFYDEIQSTCRKRTFLLLGNYKFGNLEFGTLVLCTAMWLVSSANGY